VKQTQFLGHVILVWHYC